MCEHSVSGVDDDGKWYDYLNAFGLSERSKRKIMKPQQSDISKGSNPVSVAVDLVRERCLFLQSVRDRSNTRERGFVEQNTRDLDQIKSRL